VADRGRRAGALRDRRPPGSIVRGFRRGPRRPDIETGALAAVLAQEIVLAHKLRVRAPAGNCRTRLGEDRVPVGAGRRTKGNEFDDHFFSRTIWTKPVPPGRGATPAPPAPRRARP